MLKELSRFENLGTPKYFWELFSNLKNNSNKWTLIDVQKHFYDKIIDEKRIFDGCLDFAKSIQIIEVSNGFVKVNPEFSSFSINENYLYGKILEKLFSELKNDEIFFEIFCAENISYDIIYNSIQIRNSAFHFKYSNFKQLLIDFRFLLPHPNPNINKLVINAKYKKIFDKNVLHEIKRLKIGLDRLKKDIEKKQVYGEEAENFVLEFEKKRLSSHKNPESIKKISDYDVSAGYDIVSYKNHNSSIHDRFIEVKSFIGLPNFYWSRNEKDISRIKKENYFLYLVDRAKFKTNNYAPMMVKNPYEEIFKNNNWNKQIEKYFIFQS